MPGHDGQDTGDNAFLVEAMMRSREVLLRIFHDPQYSVRDAEVWFIDRGAPGDTSRVAGSDIVSVGRFFFEIATPSGTKEIPYHRVVGIVHRGEVLWDISTRRRDRAERTG